MEFLCIEVEEACPVLQVCGRGLSIGRLVSDAALDPSLDFCISRG